MNLKQALDGIRSRAAWIEVRLDLPIRHVVIAFNLNFRSVPQTTFAAGSRSKSRSSRGRSPDFCLARSDQKTVLVTLRNLTSSPPCDVVFRNLLGIDISLGVQGIVQTLTKRCAPRKSERGTLLARHHGPGSVRSICSLGYHEPPSRTLKVSGRVRRGFMYVSIHNRPLNLGTKFLVCNEDYSFSPSRVFPTTFGAGSRSRRLSIKDFCQRSDENCTHIPAQSNSSSDCRD